ncbi:MAG: Crp/Fnr family transcriptional regulator, partial [Anaerovoracaceae bacterium]
RELTRKMEHLSQRTTRDKLLSYLSEQSIKHGSSNFEIPFNRQQLADYLAVDRSAMSKELGRLRKEGILEFSKSHFSLIGREMY